MARIASSVKVCGWPETPIRIVGWACSITSSRPIGLSSAGRQPMHAILRLGQLALEGLQAVHAVVEQALAVDQEEAGAGLGLGQALLDHRGDELLGDPAARRAGAEDRDGVVAERPAGDGHRGEQGAGGHGGRALDVVVERAELVAVALEQAVGVVLGEVLPLEQHARETSA